MTYVRCYDLPGRSKKTVLVYADYWSMDDAAWYVKHVWWIRRSHDWRIVVGDNHGADAEIARMCEQWDVPFTCVGINVSPRNGSRHYQRFILPKGLTRAAKYQARDEYMVGLADIVVCFGQSPDVQRVCEYAKRFPQKELRLNYGLALTV